MKRVIIITCIFFWVNACPAQKEIKQRFLLKRSPLVLFDSRNASLPVGLEYRFTNHFGLQTKYVRSIKGLGNNEKSGRYNFERNKLLIERDVIMLHKPQNFL